MAKWTAEDWEQCENANSMLRALGGLGRAICRRKLRLFSVALCNRFRKSVQDEHCIAALAAAEQDVDDPLPVSERSVFRRSAMLRVGRMRVYGNVSMLEILASEACVYALDHGLEGTLRTTGAITQVILHHTRSDRMNEEHRLHADLLRHIIGNPFRPFPAPPALPAAVVQLAAALEAGAPVAFALRDALLEAGQTDLAEHFAGEEPHPRGCWALDLLLGKE